jgi:hypothetical protein
MTRKLNTLFAAAALLTGITTATEVFAAEGTSTLHPPRTQVVMGQMSPDQMMTRRSNAFTGPDEKYRHVQVTHSGGTGSR